MSNERFASVWDAIENTPAEAESMKLRSELMMALKEHIARTGLNQSQAAKLFGRDALVKMASATGLHVEMRVLDAA
jgi:predicted XRE-type DNA-binding protein